MHSQAEEPGRPKTQSETYSNGSAFRTQGRAHSDDCRAHPSMSHSSHPANPPSPIFEASLPIGVVGDAAHSSTTGRPQNVSLLSEGVLRHPFSPEPASWSSVAPSSFAGAISMQRAGAGHGLGLGATAWLTHASSQQHVGQSTANAPKQSSQEQSHMSPEPQLSHGSGTHLHTQRQTATHCASQSTYIDQDCTDEQLFPEHVITEESALLSRYIDGPCNNDSNNHDHDTPPYGGGQGQVPHCRFGASDALGNNNYIDPSKRLPHPMHLYTPHTRHVPRPNLELLGSYALTAAKSLPAVCLALILNLLDAMSYGIIIFPGSDNRLPKTAPQSGISMFLASTIISQIVFTFGGSQFRGAVGSQMIEVMPFLHIMCTIIETQMPGASNQATTATIMAAYAMSTILTGVIFLLMGIFKLGSLIQFFPRHILVGCIGGIGLFLLVTAIEVTAQIKAEISFAYLGAVFNPSSIKLWGSSLGVALLLKLAQSRFSHPLLVPSFYVILPVIFYTITLSFGIPIAILRDHGWLFNLPSATEAPFWTFWTYIDMGIVDWRAVAATIPTQLALAFFGILHVPINVPALAVSTKQDVDLSYEIVGHGVSNILAGLVGTPQNYLVYSNSLLYIRSGGDSRISDIMLMCANVLLWIKGGDVIGYVPVVVVGSLIFHLGIDLLIESVVDTWFVGIHPLEYATILSIVAIMGFVGFTEGVVAGIVLACIFFVVMYSRRSIIRESFTGLQLRSTVHRLYRQQIFLDKCGDQIHIIKLQGFMFFGTINQLETHIKSIFGDVPETRFVVIDFSLISGIDYSALESFQRIRRLLVNHRTHLVLCGLGALRNDLIKSGIFDTYDDEVEEDDDEEVGGGAGNIVSVSGRVHSFATLNEALEYCENRLLETFYLKSSTHMALVDSAAPPAEEATVTDAATTPSVPIPRFDGKQPSMDTMDALMHSPLVVAATPRQQRVNQAASLVLGAHPPTTHSQRDLARPVSILLQAFSEDANLEALLGDLCGSNFELVHVTRGQTLFNVGDPSTELYVVEEGELIMAIPESHGTERVVETLLPGTMVGELELFANRPRSCRLYAMTDAVLWRLTKLSFDELSRRHPDLMLQFVTRVALSFDAERFHNTLRHWAQFR